MPQNKRFTIYDMMEAKGVFEANPANQFARDPVTGENIYKGPVQYPKMFYHPLAERHVTKPGTWETTPLGPKFLGEQKAIVTKEAKSADEEQELRKAGWHDHPAKALLANGEAAPPMSSQARVPELEAQIAALQAELEKSKALQQAPALTPKVEAKAPNPLIPTPAPKPPSQSSPVARA